MEISRFGDWEKAKRLLTNGFNQRLALAIRKATIKNALLLVREIRPETGQGDYILTPRELRPIAYEQGIDLETTL